MVVSLGDAVSLVGLIGKAVSGSLEFIRNVRRTGWANSLLGQGLDDLDCELGVIQVRIDVARIPTQQHALEALQGLRRKVAYAEGQLLELEKEVVKEDKKSGPARKACNSIVNNTWDTMFCKKWKEQLPVLAQYVKTAYEAAEKAGVFNSADTLARVPPSMYVPHLGLREKVIAALREQMDQIDRQQQQQQSRPQVSDKPAIVLIVGQPCLGKAALALDVAHAISMKRELQGKFPHGVFDITFGPIARLTKKDVVDSVIKRKQQELYRKISTERVDPDDDVSTKLGSVLFGRRSLLLLEDVHSPAIVEAFRVAGFKGALLVTGHGYGLEACCSVAGEIIHVDATAYTTAPPGGGPCVAQQIADACLQNLRRTAGSTQLNKINQLSELIVQEAGSSVAAVIALCSCVLDLSAGNFAQNFSTKSTANMMQDVYEIISLHLPPDVRVILNALEPFRSSVDIPVPLVQLAVCVARSSSSSGRRRRHGSTSLAQLFNSMRSNGNQSEAQSSFVESATEDALLQLQEAGMLNVYYYSKGSCIRLQNYAVRFLGNQQRHQQQLASRRILGDTYRPADAVQKQQRLLLAAFLTYFGKKTVADNAEKVLEDGLPYTSCQAISKLCLDESGETVQALASQINSELTAEYVAAALAESYGVYKQGCGQWDAAWGYFSTALRLLGEQDAPPRLLARLGDVKRCEATWAANNERDQLLTQAARWLQAAHKRDSEDCFTIMGLAEVLRLQGQYGAAKQLLEDAMSAGLISDSDASAYKTLGAVLLELKQYSAAEQALLQSQKVYVKDADLLALLASVKQQQQERASALQFAKDAAELLELPADKLPQRVWPETEQRVRSLLNELAAAA